MNTQRGQARRPVARTDGAAASADAARAAAHAEHARAAARTRRVPRVLVADDDRAFALFARYVMRQVGCDVDMAENATDGLALIQDASRSYDAVVVDPAFTDASGADLASQFRALRPETALVAVSESPERELPDHDLWLRKPYQPSALVHAVAEAISARTGRKVREAPRTSEAGAPAS